jgi:hypothetical protein
VIFDRPFPKPAQHGANPGELLKVQNLRLFGLSLIRSQGLQRRWGGQTSLNPKSYMRVPLRPIFFGHSSIATAPKGVLTRISHPLPPPEGRRPTTLVGRVTSPSGFPKRKNSLLPFSRAGKKSRLSVCVSCCPEPPTIHGCATTIVLILTLLMLQPRRVDAQFDMVIFEKRPPQARSREELNTVLDIVQTTDPRKIISLCTDFRKQFPTSEFLGQVYRMEMHAHGTLDDAQNMIEAGQKALEQNSHDVDALLTLANTIPNGVNSLSTESTAILDKAEGYARRALEEIDGLKATRGVPLDKWRQLTGRMRSSAQEALGFIAFKRGRYAESVREFEKSIRFNPEAGGAVFFRLGIAYLYAGKPLEAQVALERSSQLGPDLIRTKAKEQLARLGKQNRPSN